MRKIMMMALLAVLMSVATAKTRQLVILHSNDTHSCVYPLSTNLADTALAGRGGYLRRLSMIERQRREHPSLLLLDSGDFSQGSSYYTLFKGDVEVGLMNQMHYDAATIGNHEFDFGLDNLARLVRMANFPIVCANYDFAGTVLEGLVKPYVIVRREGLRIGIFGLSPDPMGLVDERKCVGVKFLDPKAVADSMATLLRKQEKCDLVICLSHLGWGIGGDDDQTMIGATSGIDVVLGGHSHTYLENLEYVKNHDGQPVPVDQNGKHGIFVGKLTLTLSR